VSITAKHEMFINGRVDRDGLEQIVLVGVAGLTFLILVKLEDGSDRAA
jgi:hypothetical protein